jgi:hypothetical protein
MYRYTPCFTKLNKKIKIRGQTQGVLRKIAFLSYGDYNMKKG